MKSVSHSKIDNIEIMINEKADEVIEECFQSLLNRYQIRLETLTSGSDFIFDCVNFLYYKFHKINLRRRRSYIDSLDWIENKKVKINPSNKNIIHAFNLL